MRTAREIRKYLKQQHWYKEYVRDVAKVPDYLRIRAVRGYLGINTTNSAFFWCDAPQDIRAWSHRDDLFVNWYNRGKKRYENKKVSSQPARSESGSRTD